MTLLTACLGDIPLVCSVLAELFSSVMWRGSGCSLFFFSPEMSKCRFCGRKERCRNFEGFAS
jgi:hypothetical protein